MATLASDLLGHFRLLWNCWTELNETWQEARSQRPLPSLRYSGQSEIQDGRSENKMAALASEWLRHFQLLLWTRWTARIQPNLTGSKISTSSIKFVFFEPVWNTRWPPWHLIFWDIFNFSSETTEWNSTKIDRKQYLNIPYPVCVISGQS